MLLGAAELTRSGRPRREATALLGTLDADGDGVVAADEWPADRDAFADVDHDGDGRLRVWELSAAVALERRPIDTILRRRTVPTLVLYGNLDDAQAHHAPILDDLIEAGDLDHVTLRVLPNIGHGLGPQQEGRTGPIDDAVLENVTKWLIDAMQPPPKR